MRTLAATALLAACTGGGDTKEPVDESITVITTATDLQGRENQLIRIKGPVFHEKLGDGVSVDGMDILCPDLRLPEGTANVTLQGRLELWNAPVAEVGAAGEISQGVAETDPARWILRDCKQV